MSEQSSRNLPPLHPPGTPLILCLLLVLALGASGPVTAAKTDTASYILKATWSETVAANRQAGASHNLANTGLQVGPWFSSTAYASDALKQTHPPEEQGQNVPTALGTDGKALWTKEPTIHHVGVHSFTLAGAYSKYFLHTLKSKEKQKVPMLFVFDDEGAVWLNGRLVFSQDGPHGLGGDAQPVTLDVNKGANTVMVKVRNIRGAAGFALTFKDNPTASPTFWRTLKKDFPEACGHWESEFDKSKQVTEWITNTRSTRTEERILNKGMAFLDPFNESFSTRLNKLKAAQTPGTDPAWLNLYQDLVAFRPQVTAYRSINGEALRRGIEDLAAHHAGVVPDAMDLLARLAGFEKQKASLENALRQHDAEKLHSLATLAVDFKRFQREVLLRNPLLDFDRLLVLKRDFGSAANTVISSSLGMPNLNSHTHDTIKPTGWNNEISVLSDLRGQARMETLYKPEQTHILCEVDLDFSGERIQFSSINRRERWGIFEIDAGGQDLRELTPGSLSDVDFFDSCYLPDGHTITTSTAPFQGLPCENGSKPMASLYLLNSETKDLRRLTYEQDSDWAPTVLPSGRVMYLRWEYTDTPHYFTRILMSANPDGTGQMEYYGSNSYFPNAFFFARPIPGHAPKVVGIAGGHHGISRSGRLLILDPSRGRQEADGVVQEIPGWGKKVEPLLLDRLVNDVWPHFLHPYPLDDKYFLVSAKLSPNALWGIYLVDVFDNVTLIKELPGSALLEPIPFRATPRPPILADRTVPGAKEASVYLADIYQGPGLAKVPRGSVKNLRLISYHYAYVKTGGHASVGVESSWDVKRILGTVPVEPDGSASFMIPANLPVALQPLDEEGRALQLMRSWLVGMPGEAVSCVGCHEPQNVATPNTMNRAAQRPPSAIKPWYGPARPFGFHHEVQPVLDRFCVGCHKGDKPGKPDFRAEHDEPDYRKATAYQALQPYVRRPGPESDYHITPPLEYHASTSELIQMLHKGHHGVQLDREAWDRLYTWIDLNAPYRGRWDPAAWRECDQKERRKELARLYEGVVLDPENEYTETATRLQEAPKPVFVKPAKTNNEKPSIPQVAQWPFDAEQAHILQGDKAMRTLLLGYVNPEGEINTADSREQARTLRYRYFDEPGAGREPVELHLTRIPAGRFVMGSREGPSDEHPLHEVVIDQPFWMGTYEISNRQFAFFDPQHDSRYADMSGKDHNARGYPLNRPDQPVTRVAWQDAEAFCAWLGKRLGKTVSLPTESQWEWACRAGTATPLAYGHPEDDFASFANLADKTSGSGKVNPFPRRGDTNDRLRFSDARGAYTPNAWGLYDMHGNVAEWTRSLYHPCPNTEHEAGSERWYTARGGSWRDRPHRATSSYRLGYLPYQKVLNVGFRVIVVEGE